MLDNSREDLSKILSYQIEKDNHTGISHAIREGDKPINHGNMWQRSLAMAICNGCGQDSIKALIEGGAEVKVRYSPEDDDLMLLLNPELLLSLNARLHGMPYSNFGINPGKIKIFLDSGAKIVDDISSLKEKIITNIHQREIHFNELNRYPIAFLRDLRSELGSTQMIRDVMKLQNDNMSSVYLKLIKYFFIHRIHDEVKNREDNRDWQVSMAMFTEKDRVVALQSYFKYHLADQHFDCSEIHKTTLNHLFLENDLIKNIRGVISSAQLLIEHNPRSVISNDIKAQFISIKENGLSEQIGNISMLRTTTYCKYDEYNQSSFQYLLQSSRLCKKHIFSTAYQIAKLVAYQVMYHKNGQDNKIEIASLIEQAIKCGLKESEIFEAISQFYQDYGLKQQIHIQKQLMDQLYRYQRHQGFLGQQEDIGEFRPNLEAVQYLPMLDYSELLHYVKECIFNMSYKEGAVIGLFQSANTGDDPKAVSWESLPAEICVRISKCLSIKDAGRVAQTCRNVYEIAKKERKLDDLSTKMVEPQLQSLEIAGPSRQ